VTIPDREQRHDFGAAGNGDMTQENNQPPVKPIEPSKRSVVSKVHILEKDQKPKKTIYNKNYKLKK